ncbi:MAG: hypothetical protein ACRELC_03635 [Gemmatimonadota bacterium]
MLFNGVTRELRRITGDDVRPLNAVIDGNVVVWQNARNGVGVAT